MSEYRGISRWSKEAVGMINWDDQAKEGTAQVTDETTGTVYEIGGGGGGESDFSTAQVTVANGSAKNDAAQSIGIVVIDNDFFYNGSLSLDEPRSVTAVLYKEKQFLSYGDNEAIESVTGNIYYDEEYECYVVTGDCTITLYTRPIG